MRLTKKQAVNHILHLPLVSSDTTHYRAGMSQMFRVGHYSLYLGELRLRMVKCMSILAALRKPKPKLKARDSHRLKARLCLVVYSRTAWASMLDPISNKQMNNNNISFLIAWV